MHSLATTRQLVMGSNLGRKKSLAWYPTETHADIVLD